MEASAVAYRSTGQPSIHDTHRTSLYSNQSSPTWHPYYHLHHTSPSHRSDHERTHHNPQPPPSPPSDSATRYSLPPISSLLSYSGGPFQDAHSPITANQNHSPSRDSRHSEPLPRPIDTSLSEANGIHQRNQLPPTPPTAPLPETEKIPSPELHSLPHSRNRSHSENGPYFVEPRNHAHANQYEHSNPLPTYNSSPEINGPSYRTQPPPIYPAPGLNNSTQQQRSLTTEFAPQNQPGTFPNSPHPSESPSSSSTGSKVHWGSHHHHHHPHHHQHHHPYLPGPGSTTSPSSFAPTQDRYVCPTCSKAFSRPSSLRIHSHSHTGEKPFKCPHKGCGKAFSVRSNMKRHERGCRKNDIGIGGQGRELLPAAAS